MPAPCRLPGRRRADQQVPPRPRRCPPRPEAWRAGPPSGCPAAALRPGPGWLRRPASVERRAGRPARRQPPC
ncbi:hypothetical protein FHR04_13685 [Deinococcus radiopugnans ATCC 19172]|uniref:Uncharacterized protein n=1 Tax=Deinococcus radiopugnans ATCC 19172 TaxID=585398 RepID=A0A5C4Y3V2_9DEIO|nr:hypothetical protein FHR04_13685 [Deinococcus radiopugnans ATCC 19172]